MIYFSIYLQLISLVLYVSVIVLELQIQVFTRFYLVWFHFCVDEFVVIFFISFLPVSIMCYCFIVSLDFRGHDFLYVLVTVQGKLLLGKLLSSSLFCVSTAVVSSASYPRFYIPTTIPVSIFILREQQK